MSAYHDRLYREYLNMSNIQHPSVGVGAGIGAYNPNYGASTQQANAAQFLPWGVQQTYNRHSPENMRASLAIRMGWNVNQSGMRFFEHCEPRKLNDEKAVVFVIHAGKAMAIEDDLNLFPSDTLVTQLRILQDT